MFAKLVWLWIFFICLLSACFLLNTSNFLLVWYSIICQRGNHCVLMVQKMLIFVSLTFWKWFPKMWFPRPKHHLPGSIYSFDSRLILTLRVPNTVKSSCPLYFLNLYIPLKVRIKSAIFGMPFFIKIFWGFMSRWTNPLLWM